MVKVCGNSRKIKIGRKSRLDGFDMYKEVKPIGRKQLGIFRVRIRGRLGRVFGVSIGINGCLSQVWVRWRGV